MSAERDFVNPGFGYRLLELGDIIQEGDESLPQDLSQKNADGSYKYKKDWQVIKTETDFCVGKKYNNDYLPIRRKCESKSEIAQLIKKLEL